MQAEPTLDSLAAAWLSAKADETSAKEKRLAIESQLCRLIPTTRPEGTVSAEAAGMKVTVVHKVSRKVNSTALREAWEGLSDVAKACFKWSADVSTTEMRAAQLANAQAYSEAAQFITADAAKPSVKVERA